MHVDLSPLVELTERSTSQETRLSMYHVIGDVTENKLHKAAQKQQNIELDPSFPKRCFLSKFTTPSKIGCVQIHTIPNSNKVYFITGNEDNTATVWDLQSFAVVQKLEKVHTSKVRAISATGSIIATASDDKTVAVWDLQSGKNLLHLMGGHECFDTVAVIWNGETGKKELTLTGGHISGVTAVSTHDCSECSFASFPELNCQLIVSSGFDKKAIVWSALSGQVLRTLEGGHSDFVSQAKVVCVPNIANIGFTPLVVTTSYDHSAVVWSLLSGDILHKLTGGHSDWITSLDVFAPGPGCSERALVLTGGHDGRGVLWDLTTGEMVRVLEGTHSGAPLTGAVVLSRNDKDDSTKGLVVLTSAENGSVVLCDLRAEQSRSLKRHTGPVTALCVVSVPGFVDDAGSRYDEISYVVSGSADKSLIVWDLRSGEALQQWAGQHSDTISAVDVYVPHGERGGVSNRNVWIVSVGFDRQAVVWDLRTGRVVRVMSDIHEGFISCVKIYNPFPETVASNISTVSICVPLIVTGSFDHTVALWNLLTGDLVVRLSAHSDYVSAVCVYDSGDFCSSMVITGSCDNSICYWDLSTGRLLKTISEAHAERIKSLAVYLPPPTTCGLKDASPKLISGSYDKCAIVWDLLGGRLLHRLEGIHTNWVTAVAVCATNDDSGNALVFSGSFDGSTVLWDLHTGCVIRKMECDHSDSIRAACMVERSTGSPLIITASNDFTVGITDTLYPMSFMPPQFSVRRAFNLDALEINSRGLANAPWPRISALSSRFKECLWRENPDLFLWAALAKRSDFFAQFQSMLKEVIHLVGFIAPGVSLLRHCITSREINSLRIVLTCWATSCNLPLRTGEVDVHASRLVSKEELVLLAREYPSEFVSFVCSLKLVSIDKHSSLFCTIVNASRTLVIGTCTSACSEDLWTSLPSASSLPIGTLSVDADSSDQPATLMYLPVKDAADIAILDAFVTTCRSLESVDLFDSEAGIIALRYAWDSFGQKAHYAAVGKYLFVLVVFTTSCLSFQDLVQRAAPFQAIAWINVCLVIYAVSYRLYVTHLKLLSFGMKGPRALFLYSTDIWNVVDLVSLPCMLIGTLLRCAYHHETATSRSFLAVASVSLWFKSLYFLRPLPSSGPLVSMILQIGFDIRFFLIVLGMVLCGFAQGFWLLSYPNETLAFGSISSALLNSFMFMLGQNVDSDFSGTASPTIATLLLVIFLMFMMILMLNLLIALMGQSFSAVSDKGLAQWRLEQATIILDQMFMTRPEELVSQPFIFVLRYSSDLDKAIESISSEEKVGLKLAALERRVDNVAVAVTHKLDVYSKRIESQSSSSEIKTEARIAHLEAKFSSLDFKLDQILSRLR